MKAYIRLGCIRTY